MKLLVVALGLVVSGQATEPTIDERLSTGLAALHDYAFDKALAEFRAVQASERNHVMAV